ncbi:30S ribosomal protein S6--L-glutamate ligase [Luteolibacter marinus]|uniref:30S ribosomal protein S6--L-glutamate ligase n=1 Tax=Luteolibacter marinus TaxID=2776705 RepID=UPI00186668B2|nr:30S ribosomal protein S6--L-glutamate ligase [Luteolibacter marinus]
MKIGILSCSPKCYSTRRLKEAAEKRGHRVFVLNTLRLALNVEGDDPHLMYNGKTLSTYDAVIPRIGASITFYGLAVLRQFEQMGVSVLNPALGISRSRDKLHAMQILSRHDIGMPHTAFVRRKEDVLGAIQAVGGAPVIIKLLEGTQGVGVILADTAKVAQAIVETLQSTKQNVLIQKFVKESKGKDLRAFVVGDRVVGAMRRQAQGDEFRSNVHRGGSATAVKLTPEYEETAVRAAQILGLKVAGVDMLEGNDGPQVMEVNSSPGLEGIETSTRIDIAGLVIEELEKKVLFPEMDYRQRLTISAGFGVAEFTVANLPMLEGKKLRETNLMENRIQVLNIIRNKVPIPIPDGDTLIETGDKLICYGDLLHMRSMMESERKRQKKARRSKNSKKKDA